MQKILRCMRRGDMRAFSVNEVLIVMAITVFLSGILLSYNRSSQKQIVIFKDQALIVGVLNRAKSLATERYTGAGGANACAFGVFIDAAGKTLTLFQDIKPGADLFSCKNQDGSYTPSMGAHMYSPDIDARETLETVALDARTSVTLTADGTGTASDEVLFIPPDIEATSSQAFPIVVTLSDAAEENTAFIRILQNGQITTR